MVRQGRTWSLLKFLGRFDKFRDWGKIRHIDGINVRECTLIMAWTVDNCIITVWFIYSNHVRKRTPSFFQINKSTNTVSRDIRTKIFHEKKAKKGEISFCSFTCDPQYSIKSLQNHKAKQKTHWQKCCIDHEWIQHFQRVVCRVQSTCTYIHCTIVGHRYF